MIINSSLHRIIKPIWYYSLKVENYKHNYWIDYRKIKPEYLRVLDIENFYNSKNAYSYDLAYQLWHKGVIDCDDGILLKIEIEEVSSLHDQYVFIRRMFKPGWIYYSFILRFLFMKVSLKEIKVLFHTRFIKKINLNKPIYKYKDYDLFQSKLAIEKRLISIIIPTLNRYKYLHDALLNLENQTYKNFEVIIVDQSDNFNKDFYNNYELDIKLIYQKNKALWQARNSAVKKARGEYFLFFDDDSQVDSNWVLEHLKCLEYFNADISAGVSKSKIGI